LFLLDLDVVDSQVIVCDRATTKDVAVVVVLIYNACLREAEYRAGRARSGILRTSDRALKILVEVGNDNC